MFKLNSKKLIALLFIILGFLGGLGVGRFSTERQSTERTREVEEDSPPLVMYGIGSGETYPEWKKFINYVAGYSIEYPPEGQLEVLENGEIVGIGLNVPGGPDIRVFENINSLTPKDWAEETDFRQRHKGILKEWETTIGGKNAYCFLVSHPGGMGQHSIIANTNKIYVIDFGVKVGLGEEADGYLNERLPKMLNTFKTIE